MSVPDTMDRVSRHRLLIVFAWAAEVVAVSINILMLVAVLARATTEQAHSDWPSLAIASAPFLLVVVAELSKIPFALTLMETRWSLRPMFFAALIGMAAITFFNMSRGFEENFYYQVREIREAEKEIDRLEAERSTLQNKLAQERSETANDENQKRSVLADLDTQQATLRAEKASENEQLEQIRRHTEEELQKILDHQGDILRHGGAGLNSKRIDSINQNAQRQMRPHEDRIVQIDRVLSELQEKRDRTEASAPALNSERVNRTRDFAEQVADLDRKIDAAKADNANRVVANQVYRFAAALYGKKPIEVSRDDADRVATYYFGALGILAAIVGPLLAIASHLRRAPPGREWLRSLRTAGTDKLAASCRRYVQRLRKRARIVREVEKVVPREVEKVVTVTREVPIDRVVEVAKEVIKEVPVDRVVEVVKEVVKEVPVDRVVVKEVAREVIRHQIMPIPILPEMQRELEGLAGRTSARKLNGQANGSADHLASAE
jgi:hypothetical protein